MKIIATAFYLIGVSALTSDPGLAASVTYNIQGTISSITDPTSYFDQALLNKPFSAIVTFNLEGASIETGVNQTLVGNSVNQNSSPGGASFNAGSVQYNFGINQYTIQTALNAGSTPSSVINLFSSPDSYNFDYLYFNLGSNLLSNGVSPLLVSPLEGYAAQYQHNFGDSATGSQYAVLFLTPTSLEITTDVSAVPLPASLPMFGAALLGMAALGFARRKASTAA